MAIFLKKFETMSQYNAYTADTENFILPNVSLTVDNNAVHYNPSTPPTPSHDYVEIGGIKWATMNVGANSITDTGLYFQWGDTQGYTADQVGEGEGQKYFGWSDYKYMEGGTCESDYGTITKYNVNDGLTTLQSSDDAVTAAWGGNWRMPTNEEFEALGTATTSVWTADYEGSGVAGYVLTSKADSSKKLFFPVYGTAICGSVVNNSYYWSSSLNNELFSLCMMVDEYTVSFSDGEYRNYGMHVRGVLDE